MQIPGTKIEHALLPAVADLAKPPVRGCCKVEVLMLMFTGYAAPCAGGERLQDWHQVRLAAHTARPWSARPFRGHGGAAARYPRLGAPLQLRADICVRLQHKTWEIKFVLRYVYVLCRARENRIAGTSCVRYQHARSNLLNFPTDVRSVWKASCY